MKRLFDVVASALGLVLGAPVIFVCILLVRRETPGPGLFKQVRVGRDGAPFHCYKLRTMFAGSPSVPTHEAGKAMVTPLGGFLRRSKLDELPQLWNVLKGEMSFVGPRPCLPSQQTLIGERQARGVLTLRPGITGLAQVRGIDMSDPVLLAETDAEYKRMASFIGDVRLILQTVAGGGRGDRVRV